MKILRSKSLLESVYKDFLLIFAGVSFLSVCLLAVRMLATDSMRYGFLVWNLFLAWIPALIAWRIVRFNGKHEIRPVVLLLLTLWLLFLPNTFYIVTDFIHLDRIDGISKLFDGSMVFVFSVAGFGLGIANLLVIHEWLGKYISKKKSAYIIGTVVVLSGFAIYLGRYLRWNTWDVLFNPFGLLFDISDRFINPGSHPQTFSTTVLFTCLIGGIYVLTYVAARSVKHYLTRQ